MSVFVPIPCCFDYCSLVVLSEVWEDYFSSFVLFPQDCFGHSGSFMFHINFRINLTISAKKASLCFHRDYIESANQFGEYCHLNNIKSYNPST